MANPLLLGLLAVLLRYNLVAANREEEATGEIILIFFGILVALILLVGLCVAIVIHNRSGNKDVEAAQPQPESPAVSVGGRKREKSTRPRNPDALQQRESRRIREPKMKHPDRTKDAKTTKPTAPDEQKDLQKPKDPDSHKYPDQTKVSKMPRPKDPVAPKKPEEPKGPEKQQNADQLEDQCEEYTGDIQIHFDVFLDESK